MPQSSIVARDAANANTKLESIYDSTANTHSPVHFCGGQTAFIVDSKVRPNNGTAYVAGGAIGNTTSTVFTFNTAARKAAGTGQVISAKLTKGGIAGSQTIPSGFALRFWIYSTTPSSPPADAAVFSPNFATRAQRLGYVDFTDWAVGSDCVESVAAPVVSPLGFASDANNRIYGVLQTIGTFTPIAAETYEISLTIILD